MQGVASMTARRLAPRAMASRSVFSRGFQTNWGADGKIVPHGGKIMENMASEAEASALLSRCDETIELNDRQMCDAELLMVGGFSPLEGFMNQDAYDSVVDRMRLPGSDLLFGLPVVMDVPLVRDDIIPGKKIALTYKGTPRAILDVEDRWAPNKPKETKMCYGTSSIEHPGTLMVATERGPHYVGGKVTGISIPTRDFECKTPNQVRANLKPEGDIVAFQCRNPIHRAHYELFTRALDAENVNQANRTVLVHPTCGPTQADDIPGDVRYQTYEVLKKEVGNPEIEWAYLPYSMHMAGPREAIQHMLIRKNYGCTHFIIGRDMAGSKSSLDGEDFYGAYDAQDFAKKHSEELGIKTVASLNLVSTEEGYMSAEDAKAKGLKPVKLSGTEFRRRLRGGEEIPNWFAFKSVVEVLRAHV